MNWLTRIVFSALALFAADAALAQTAQEIVAATDRVRNPDQPFRSVLTLTEYVGGKERDHDVLEPDRDEAVSERRNNVHAGEGAGEQGRVPV